MKLSGAFVVITEYKAVSLESVGFMIALDAEIFTASVSSISNVKLSLVTDCEYESVSVNLTV